MVKIIFFIICVISSLVRSSTSTIIVCNYSHKGNYYGIGSVIYHCKVSSDPRIITKESAEISELRGENYRSNDQVLGFTAESRTHQDTKTIKFFPKGLDKYFKNLKAIFIYNCQLKEIHQSDLKGFPNLEHLQLQYNEIEVIEAGLFDFNPKLTFLGFDERKVIHIDPNVFDHLDNLCNFWFAEVPCARQFIVAGIKEKTQEAIQAVKSSCFNLEFLSLDSQLKNLEIESKTLSTEAFKIKIDNFEKIFRKSELSKTQTLNNIFQKLKSSIIPTQVDHVLNIPNNETLSNNSKNITEDLNDSQCVLIDDLKASQNETQVTLSEIKSLITGNGSKLDVQDTCMNDLKVTLNSHGSTLSILSSTLDSLKNSHNEISKTLIDLKRDMNLVLDEKLEIFEENLMNLENRNGKIIDEIKKELEHGRYVLSTSMDSKLKAVENRLMEKMERILRALYIF